MFVTKLGHSCVLVETDDRIGLFDPGVWSDRVLIDAVEHVDRIIYTHEHPDHFDIDILRSLVKKFPQAHTVCNSSIEQKIVDSGIECIVREETQCSRKFEAPHEELPWPGIDVPTETGYHFKDMFSAPGDSYSFHETKKILAMPFVSPWGKVGDGIQKVIELQPEYVLPVHDWLYNDESRQWLNSMLEGAFKGHNITLLSAENGVRHEIEE